jgi:hypothetical protein
MTVVEHASRFLEKHLSRRSFLVRGTFAATALAVTPKRYVLEPGTAYEAFCGEPQCGNANCSCGSACCEGFSTFCCTINNGYNYCPEGSVVGGWWAAADSTFCGNGTRYYIDCNGVCHCDTGCGDYYMNGDTFCDFGCDGLDCKCQGDNCDNWVESCFQFRYGQCNTDVGCTGRIICRMVSCVAPWKLDFDCGSSYMWDSGTAEMNAPCNTSVPEPPPPPCDSSSTRCETVAIASPEQGSGYFLATSYGKVIPFGSMKSYGDLTDRHLAAPIVAMETTSTGDGYWLLSSNGGLFRFGEARLFPGSAAHEDLQPPIAAIALTPSGKGYWLVTQLGHVYPYGDAESHGSLAHRPATRITGMAGTSTGSGYWLLEESGEIHTFGDAANHGSPYASRPKNPVIAIRRSRKGAGYYVLGDRGNVWPYGDATHAGDPYAHLGYWDTVGLALNPGEGYWVTTADGGIFSYGGATSHGSAN